MGEEAFHTLWPSDLDEPSLHRLRVHAETVSDIVAIEAALGEDLAPCIGAYGDALECTCARRASSWRATWLPRPAAPW